MSLMCYLVAEPMVLTYYEVGSRSNAAGTCLCSGCQHIEGVCVLTG